MENILSKTEVMENQGKPGYKKTKLGWLPEDWKVKKFDSVFRFIANYSFSRANLETVELNTDDFFNIHYGDIHSKYELENLDFSKESKALRITDFRKKIKSEDLLKEGDLIIADASEDYEGVCDSIEILNIGNYKITGGLHTFIARDKNGLTEPGFRSFILKNPPVHKILKRIATGISVYGVSKTNLSKIEIPIPTSDEQTAIASIIHKWDRAIIKHENLLERKTSYKKGLMQQLLTGKKRLPGFSGEWKQRKLGFYLREYNLKVGIDEQYEVLTSAREGLIKQSEYYNSGRISEKKIEGFNIIPPGFITYRSRSDDKSFKFNLNYYNLTGCVSKYYPVFSSTIDTNFFYYFLNYNNRYLSRYAVGSSQLVLSFKELSNVRLSLPEDKEQIAISNILLSADKEIELIKKKKELLQNQKRGLMQQLLTGIKRLRTN